jgi:FkbM family methyltransferase
LSLSRILQKPILQLIRSLILANPPQRNPTARLLDRPGGRTVLSAAASWYAGYKLEKPIAISYHDGFWGHRVGGYYFVDSPVFEYTRGAIRSWRDAEEAPFRAARDFWFHVYQPKPGDVIVDIGAGIGMDTLAFSQSVGAGGRVVAVEAHPATFKILQQMCTLNKLDNTEPIGCAVMDVKGRVFIEDLAFHEANTVSPVFDPLRHRHAVAADSLDNLCEELNIDHIDFLKMNIEGAERLAIKGMQQTIRSTEHICIACHDFIAESGGGQELRTKTAVTDFLLGHGFEIITRTDDPRDFVRDHIHGVRCRAGA